MKTASGQRRRAGRRRHRRADAERPRLVRGRRDDRARARARRRPPACPAAPAGAAARPRRRRRPCRGARSRRCGHPVDRTPAPGGPPASLSGRCGCRSARGSRRRSAVSGSGAAARLLGRLLAQQRRADRSSRRRSGSGSGGTRTRRRLDERQARVLVAAVERQRGERAADQVRRADAVAGVAERAVDARPPGRLPTTGRWLGETSIGPPQACVDPPARELREEAAQVLVDLGDDARRRARRGRRGGRPAPPGPPPQPNAIRPSGVVRK